MTEIQNLFVTDPSVREASEELNCTASHIYQMLHRGVLTSYKIGGARRLHRETLNALRGQGHDSKF